MFSRGHFHTTGRLKTRMLCMLTNNEHRFIKAFLFQPNVCLAVLSQPSVYVPLFFCCHPPLCFAIVVSWLHNLRERQSTQISFSVQKKKQQKTWSFLECVASHWRAANAKWLLQEVSLLGDLARKQVLEIEIRLTEVERVGTRMHLGHESACQGIRKRL